MGRRSAPRNHAGVHFLGSRFAADLVRLAGVGPGDLVFDLGAGLGALTSPLADSGARVVAVERDEQYAERLRRRFATRPNVTVVTGDLRLVPLPRRDFRVVANIPFATTAALLRRLLDPPGSRLTSAYLVVEWGAGRRLSAWSREPAGAWWGARFELRSVHRLNREAFRPPPTVDAEVLAVDRCALAPGAEAALRELLRLAGRDPDRSLRTLLAARFGPGELRALGLDPRAPAGTVGAAGWRALAVALGARNARARRGARSASRRV